MRNRYVLAADAAAFLAAAYGAFALRFDWFVHQYWAEFVPFALAALVVKPAVFYLFGMYKRYWRYATLRDMQALLLATSSASALLAVLVSIAIVASLVPWFSRSVLLIDYLLTTVMIAGFRLSIRVVAESRTQAGSRAAAGRRVIVVGAGDAGTMVVREMQRNAHLGLMPVAFLDDDRVKVGKRICGVPVVGTTEQLARVAAETSADEAVIAMPRVAGKTVRRMVSLCQAAGISSRTMPGIFELLDGNVSVNRLRTVDIADLLRRPQILSTDDVARYIHGRCALVTGAGGSIGLELCRQLAAAQPSSLVLVGHGENSVFDAVAQLRAAFPALRVDAVIADIRDAGRIARVLQEYGPTAVFHAAAHKHVPLMEENPSEAVTNNVIGTHNVVQACLRVNVERFVLISTDKAVAPASLMGASKRFAELIVRDAARASGRAFSVVRFGNVLGSRGSVVPILKQQIDRGGPVTITHPEMRRFFMTIPEAVHLVLQAGGIARGGELFVLNMGQPIRILDLAQDLISLSGFSRDEIPIVFSGVRPGEKLEEQLWERSASVEPTENPEILRVTEPSDSAWTSAELTAALQRFVRLAEEDDRMGIQAMFAQWIPSFAPAYTAQTLPAAE